jgi:hypothetical protein
MLSAARRKRRRLTLRAWGMILGVVLMLPLVAVALIDRNAAFGTWPWKAGPQASFFSVRASAWVVLACVIGCWVLFMALAIGRRERLFLWSFFLLAWIYTLGQVDLVTMFRPDQPDVAQSLRWLVVPDWSMGGTWLGVSLVAAAVVVVAVCERVLRRHEA